MKLRSFRSLLLLVVVLAWAGCVGCSGPGTINNNDDDNTPADACTGDACGTTDDARDTAGGETDISGDDVRDDQPQPDKQGCTNVCHKGEIKCDGTERYYTCVQDGECWEWNPMWGECKGNNVCTCTEDENAVDDVCEAEDPCVCIPECEDKECGADGCGGECGSCEEGFYCDAFGSCSEDCPNDCAEGETKCNGDKVQYCINIFADDTGVEPCWTFGDAEECPGDVQTCDPELDECVCPFAKCGETCCDTEAEVCFGDACCTPDCDGKICGDDGCGGSCGTCAAGTFCSNNQTECSEECESNCDDLGEKICNDTKTGYTECKEVADAPGCLQWAGPFGCEGGTICDDDSGECVCVPDCEGYECGDDGCGGSCGTCDGTYVECQTDPGQPNYNQCVCDCEGQPLGVVCDPLTNTEYLSGCHAICAGVQSYDKGPCPTCQDDCTEDELGPPVLCGFDQITYENFCELKCAIGGEDCTDLNNCSQVLHAGECKPDCCESEGCPIDYNPICGDDGVTYCNECDFQLCPEDPNNLPGLYCVGQCPDLVACPDCPETCDPVCGMVQGDKRNYANMCLLECSGAELLWEGQCCLGCGEDEEWVCGQGEDGFHAHLNECFLQCQSQDLPLYEIPTLPTGEVWFDLCESCECDISEPVFVCGDDYVTYASTCALECAFNAALGPMTTEPLCEGKCFEDCPCPPDLDSLSVASQVGPGDDGKRGVCGLDGNTYGNACHAAKYGTLVTSQIWCEECAANCPDDGYDPVCCDGVTYANSCVVDKCNDYLDPATCFKGTCCLDDADCDDGDDNTTDTCNAGVCENL